MSTSTSKQRMSKAAVAARIAARLEYASAPMTALLTAQQVGVVIGRTPRTLETWRSESKGPVHTRVGIERLIRYRKYDVEAWIAESGTLATQRGEAK